MTPQSIIDHNNMAVALMEQQHIKPAIDNAMKALEIQREQTKADRLNSWENNNITSIDECMLLTKVESRRFYFNNNRNFIYGQGIPIPPKVTDPTKISAIVIFNLALAYHLWAVKNETAPSRSFLAKAKQLYELTYDLHAQADRDVLFPFAVLNNLALVEHSLGNTAKSMKYFELLTAVKRALFDEESFTR